MHGSVDLCHINRSSLKAFTQFSWFTALCTLVLRTMDTFSAASWSSSAMSLLAPAPVEDGVIS